MNGRSVSEPTRERETFKYDPSLLTDIIYNEDGRPINNAILRTGQDAVLTAIASLGASRLKTAASLVSLFDQKWQFVVAEATPSLTLAPRAKAEDRHDEPLWLCGTAIPRCDGVCEHTLISQNPNDFEEVGESASDLPLSLVEDLAQDARHCSKPWCLPGSPARFYAAVPIRSPRGINIGVYCVIDSVPRSSTEWNERSTQTMRELSQTITDYLELRRSKHEYRRSGRMTRGLGSFVDGKSTTTGWHPGTKDSVQDGAEGTLNVNQQSIERERDAAARRGSEARPDSPESPLRSPDSLPSVDAGQLSLASPSAPSTLALTTMVYPPAAERGVLVSSPLNNTSTNGEESARDIFSKAANLIRESIEIEGALFLDASLKSFGGLLGADGSTSASLSEESDNLATNNPNVETQSPCCDVLGFSTSHSSSIDGAKDVPRYTTVPEKLLSALLRRYPKGKIFTFDERGALEIGDSSDGDTDPGISPSPASEPKEHRKNSRGSPWARHLDGAAICDIFPGARSVAFVPVWDAKKERYYAGCFAFTRAAIRVFTEEGELAYLRAFGMLAMSETHRLEAVSANKAKSDVLSSLSHELRSPLHGVILGVELLHDTQLDVFQGDVLHTVETCGRTLSDTIDHLLDFAKINNYKAVEKQQRKQGHRGQGWKDRSNTSIEDGMKSLVADVRLDVLAEEVLESVAAGSTFQRMSIAQLYRKDNRHIDRKSNQHLDSLQAVEELGVEHLQNQLQPRNVSIYLDIDHGYAWAFRVSPGSLRRILMNLFGNSLKYTREGAIKVSLNQETVAQKGRTKRRVVKITVADTGKGISEDFLRNELFKPFSQEDSLAPGTGLGLSLVKQIVSTLGGTISIQSGLNVGTKITVTLPLTPAAGPSPLTALAVSGEDQDFDAHVQRLRGLRVKLLGFKKRTAEDVSDNKFHDFDDYALMERVCRDWLGLEVIPDDDKGTNQVLPDLLLCTEPGLDNFESNRPPTVVVCANTLVAHHRAASAEALGLEGVMEFISQPVGPRKLAKTLSRVHREWSEGVTLFSPGPTESPQTSERERRLSDVLPTRPKLVRSHTTSDSRFALAARATPERKWSEHEAGTQAAIEDLPTSVVPQPSSAAIEPPDVDNSASPDQSVVATPDIPSLPATLSPSPGDDPIPAAQTRTPEFLLVDDNPINLKILSSYMKKLKCAYNTAADGQDAVDTFCRAPPPGRYQVIFMDISMPRLNGFEATRQIRAFERETHLPPAAIFALSGLASAEAQQEAFASGIDLFLAKPVRLKELSSILTTRGFL